MASVRELLLRETEFEVKISSAVSLNEEGKMNTTLYRLATGSRGFAPVAPKNQPQPQLKTTTVRRIQGSTPWFEPDSDLQGARREFEAGILLGPTFNPRAKVMKDVFCGTSRVSEAEVTGVLVQFEKGPPIPSDADRTCVLGYDSEAKVFYDKENRREVITEADYLVLLPDGSSVVGWKK